MQRADQIAVAALDSIAFTRLPEFAVSASM